MSDSHKGLRKGEDLIPLQYIQQRIQVGNVTVRNPLSTATILSLQVANNVNVFLKKILEMLATFECLTLLLQGLLKNTGNLFSVIYIFYGNNTKLKSCELRNRKLPPVSQ